MVRLGRLLQAGRARAAELLDMPDAFDTIDNARVFYQTLWKKDPEAYLLISAIEGKFNQLIAD